MPESRIKKALSEGDSQVYKNIFLATFAVMCVIMAVMSQSAAINGDEKYHTYITNHILNFYTSFGKDTSLFIGKKEALDLIKERGEQGAEDAGVDVDDIPMSNDLMFYGGFFEVISALATKAFGYTDDSKLGFHNIRHFLVSIFGMLILLFAGLTAKEIFNWRAALLAALLLFISPRFFGHALMNPKDIPFAFGYMMALFFMSRFLKEFPSPSWKTTLGLLAGIVISINIRIGGILLLMYLLLFAMVFWYYNVKAKDLRFSNKALGNLAIKIALLAVLGYFLGLLFWPYGLIDPIHNPLAALARFSKYPARINQLFEGVQIRSNKLPWYFLPKYLVISNPLSVVLGFALFPVLIYWMKKFYRRDLAGVVLFLFVFPLLYIIIKKSTVYSGARHVLFIYPPMVVLAAIGWESAFHLLKSATARVSVVAVIVVLSGGPAVWVFAEQPLQYVYFNALVGGTKEAYKDYDTDYWQLSIKEATEWFAKNVKHNRKIIVATNCPYPAEIYLKNLSDSVEVKYVRYYPRSDADWDYGIFYVDFIEPYQLKKGYYPPDHTIYTVTAGGAPMCAVVDRTDRSDFLGFQAIDHKDFDKALALFTQAAKTYPHNESVLMGIGAAYLFKQQPEKAIEPLTHSLQLMPKQALTNYYLALANAQTGKEQSALTYLQRAIEINRKIKPAYKLMAEIYEQQGDKRRADFFRSLYDKVQMPVK